VDFRHNLQNQTTYFGKCFPIHTIVFEKMCAVHDVCSSLGLNELCHDIASFLVSEHFHAPLKPTEYIFDVTTELSNQKKDFHLLFQRTTWFFDIKFEYGEMFIDVMYHQVNLKFNLKKTLPKITGSVCNWFLFT
jgi:hypothetical protein